ncbi:MAG TPA: CoA transferase, partial [Myxococcota bacterium]|nr:CoA transferase [Myxococcota bacterium]
MKRSRADARATLELVTVPGPLSGVLVVDLSRVLAGPFCTMVLADLGARVIKVEAPRRGDDSRHIGPFVGARSAYFTSLNRGKQSIALDLRQADDRRIFERLLARADVLVENFRPGAMQRLGYSWDALHARFPRLIAASTSGFGQTGPYASRPSYDLVAQAMGGIMSVTGQPGGRPTRVGTSIGDIAAGLFAAIGIEAALLERERSGAGQRVDVSLLDSQVAILENAIVRHAVSGEIPAPLGSRHPSIAPFDAFATQDGFVVIAAGNDELFAKLCEALGAPEWREDARFCNNDARIRHVDALTERIEAALAKRSSTDWLDRLQRAGLPCGPIHDIAAVVSDPQVRARNMLVSVDDGAGGRLEIAGNPI